MVRCGGVDTRTRVDTTTIRDLVTTLKPGKPKERTVFRIPNVGYHCKYIVHNASVSNTVRAVAERVFRVEGNGGFIPPPPGDAKIFRARLGDFRRRLCKELGSATRLNYDQLVDLYFGRKKTIYKNATDSLRLEPIELKDSRINAFVKGEKVRVTDAKPDPAPRIIQPRKPRYNAELGTFLKHIEHRVYEAIAEVLGDITVTKGLNTEQLGVVVERKFHRFRNCVAVGLDASRFDQHVRRYALEWEHSVYLNMYRGEDKALLARLLKMQLRNRCAAHCGDGVVKYTTDGCRMSGDMNTALGNCLLMCAMVHAYCGERGVQFELINNGDDCVVFMEAADVDRFNCGLVDWFKQMGFTMKVEAPVDVVEKIEFCHMHPVHNGEQYVMVRNFPECLDKDSNSILPIPNVTAAKNWFKDIGDCGAALTAGVPVVQAYYGMLRRWGEGARGFGNHSSRETGMWFLAQGLTPRDRTVMDHARWSFYLAFGITPDMQVSLERSYERMCCPSFIEDVKHCPTTEYGHRSWVA